ncbi:hypothetical protein NQ176_g1584 [Zarea fungicola]|uniref:Uncharacterized protein n=1 Tax=Zarea fungicola TaxID=93591 RepID=A0ACC1NS65_9HYPO|nr:hypothetical protein NQ176_g1584 [Lecanicillium fungicola]
MGFFRSQLLTTPTYPTESFVGKTCIVTGSNSGLGKEAARHFARLGASRVILAVRNAAAGEASKLEIESSTGCGSTVVEVWELDLASFVSVKAFASRAQSLNQIDVLCENAAVAAYEYSCAEGHERTIVVNIISTFLLGLLLLPKLQSTSKSLGTGAHWTVVSSEVHAYAKFPEAKEPAIFKALDENYQQDMSDCYRTSKLLAILILRQIAPKIAGSGVICNYLSPGLCHSGLFRSAGWLPAVLKFVFARSAEVGSRTLVAAAVAPQESHGKYMIDGVIDDEALSLFVKSEDGAEAGKRVWAELSTILEKIEPGITSL